MKTNLIKSILGIGLAFIILFFGVDYYIKEKESRLKQELNQQIDHILDGKNVVSDGEIYSAEVVKASKPETLNILGPDGKPISSEYDDYKDIKSLYKLNRGGFCIYSLMKKTPELYTYKKYYSSEIGYVVNKFDSWGNNQWPSINTCYSKAFEYFIQNDNDLKNSFISGKKSEIINFPDIKNEYYIIKKNLDFTSGGHPCIANYYSKVFYYYVGEDYIVLFDSNARTTDFIKLFIIGSLIIGVLSFIFMYKPKKKSNISNENNSQDAS